MESIILLVHVLVAVGVISMIMLQQGKGAETGASFGSGASQTVFGSQGSANFLSRTTAVLATVFFVTSLGLAMMARQKADGVTDAGLPSIQIEQTLPVNDAPFSVDTLESTTGNDAPMIESQPVESSDSGSSESTK
ncbi:preprotein translocase subunit SecG [Endozoicomonas sp.]|uniref:preprotein translocase subunit SecG n=1 Tax=Endozoicomonas sp. TaxID=1892382 RepID=UPI002888696B|nr:preprotein translocase subunit SecG [Endozoicomonas sp.]